jgi:hypothetical protein
MHDIAKVVELIRQRKADHARTNHDLVVDRRRDLGVGNGPPMTDQSWSLQMMRLQWRRSSRVRHAELLQQLCGPEIMSLSWGEFGDAARSLVELGKRAAQIVEIANRYGSVGTGPADSLWLAAKSGNRDAVDLLCDAFHTQNGRE